MKILLIALSGIGNTILATPFIQSLRNLYPDSTIDLLTHKKSFAECLNGSKIINSFFDLEHRKAITIIGLHKKHYDISFCLFPSNKWQFALLSFLIGAKQRCSHRYFCGNHLSFLLTNLVEADPELHDVEQNMRLL
ncbi:MAG: glycosyltransferase family 9 protein, partial [Nanoarchaeota archaeon]